MSWSGRDRSGRERGGRTAVLRRRKIPAAAVAVAVAAVLGWAAVRHLAGFGASVEDWAFHIRTYGYLAWAAAAFLVVAHAVFPYVPFVLLAGANVAVFGPVCGFLLNWLGIAAGASLLFWLSRGLLRDAVRRKWKDHPLAVRFEGVTAAGGWGLVLVCRLIPVVPSALVDGLAGVSGMTYGAFVFGTLVGTFPVIAVESFFGGSLFRPGGVAWARLGAAGLLWLAVILAGLWVGRLLMRRGYGTAGGESRDR
ncbi:MAG: TVP38/TMEM64 family protein [Alicyclobacillaceae bacterium]|nr:TVP38/TMEM64 family protein [Alicyclobacillaceae bacterium]